LIETFESVAFAHLGVLGPKIQGKKVVFCHVAPLKFFFDPIVYTGGFGAASKGGKFFVSAEFL